MYQKSMCNKGSFSFPSIVFASCLLPGKSVGDFLKIYKAVLNGVGSTHKRLVEQLDPPYDRSNFSRNAIIGELAISSPEMFDKLDLLVRWEFHLFRLKF